LTGHLDSHLFFKKKKERLEGLAFQQKIYIFIKEEQKKYSQEFKKRKKIEEDKR